MSKADLLLKRAAFFEKMALAGDRKSLLASFAQDPFANMQVTTSGPYGQTIAGWLQQAQQIGQKLSQIANNPDPQTSVDTTGLKGLAGQLSNATSPVSLSYLLGALNGIQQFAGEGSGNVIPQLAQQARSLAAKFQQAYTPRKPQVAMSQSAKAAIDAATPVIKQWQNIANQNMFSLMDQQSYSQLLASSKALNDALVQAQGDEDNPYTSDAEAAQAKASVAPLQRVKQQMDSVVAQVEKWRQTSAGFQVRTPAPVV